MPYNSHSGGASMLSKLASAYRWILYSARRIAKRKRIFDSSGITWVIDSANALDQHVLAGRNECEDVLAFVGVNRGTAFDVGANAGYWSLTLAKYGFEVFAFEPDPVSRGKLELNVKVNESKKWKLRVFDFALSNLNGEAIFNVRRSIDGDSNMNLGLSSLVTSADSSSQIKVRTATLDSIFDSERLNEVSFIKIDVEGAELLVLSGAIRTISRHKPVIVWECLLNSELNRSNSREVFFLLTELGYFHWVNDTGAAFRRLSDFDELEIIGADLNIISLSN